MQTKNIHTHQKSAAQGFLTLISPTHRETFEVGEFLTMGRDDHCKLIISDPFTSNRHARIEKKSLDYVLRDLRSRNGTLLNGVSIVEAKLKDQDIIRIGETELIFTYQRDIQENTIFTTSKNPFWNDQLKRVPTLAQSQLPVLLGGPSGCGKEVIARLIHQQSQRSQGAFVSVNCSALSESLIESELFGHVRGSFTGASQDRKGAFESARGGTLFLDEIGDLPLSLQPKLLRALENQEIKPVGSDQSIYTDVRIVTATHQNLRKQVECGHFREDLYYRLNVIKVAPPALSHRMEDFDDLLFFFAKKMRVKFSHTAIEELKQHGWPGNIRELKNTVARASAMFPADEILPGHLTMLIETAVSKTDSQVQTTTADLPVIKRVEREIIIKALFNNKGNQRQTAFELGMPKSTLHDRIKHFNINVNEFKT